MKTSICFAVRVLLALTVGALRLPAYAQAVTVLHSFANDGTDGLNPQAPLAAGADGTLYGTTFSGGPKGDGTVFKITPNGTETVLYQFGKTSTDGTYPVAALVVGSDGTLYGTTESGGQYGGQNSDGTTGFGTVFKITPSGTESVLHSFGSGTDGKRPTGALVFGKDGNLYGTTQYGGQYDNDPYSNHLGDGTVFKITTAGAESVLHSFDTADGNEPPAGLVLSSDGVFYGTTSGGGAAAAGTVFQITAGGTETVLHSFTNDGKDGFDPQAGVIVGPDGTLYGTTVNGGKYGYDDAGDGAGFGTVYKITTSNGESVLHSFNNDGVDGVNPATSLIVGADGNLYGTAEFGGPNGYDPTTPSSSDGVVFKITPGGTETIVHSFNNDGTDGANPLGALVIGADGSFYGTTDSGGQSGYYGTVFTIAKDHFVVSAPATAKAGTPFSVKVTAQDYAGNTDTGYGGTIALGSTDGMAVLPSDAPLTNGVGTFSVTLETAQPQTVTATDTAAPGITGTSATITVSAGPPAELGFYYPPTETVAEAVISPAPSVEVIDAYGNPSVGSVVAVSLASGTGVLGGTKTQAVDEYGLATFPDLTLSRPGAKTLGAMVVGTTGEAISPTFNVTADDKLTAAGVAVSAGAKVSFTGTVTTFTDTDKISPATDFTASVTWGDGTAATAGTVSGSSGAFTVAGTHTYVTEGTYTVSVTLTDTQTGGPKASTTAKATVKDTTAPTTTAKLSPAAPNGLNSYYKSAVTVTLSATDPDNTASEITTSYSVDGAAAKTYTAAFSVATDGSHTVAYHSVDKAGNAEAAKTITFKIDATAPVTTATAAKVAAGERVTLKAADALSGVSSTVYWLDGATAKTYTAPFTVSVNGAHTVTYHSTDKAGNAEAAKTLKLTVAVALPSTTATLSGTLGTNGYYTTTVTVTLKTTAGGLAVAKRYYQLDGGASAAYTAPLSVTGDKAHTVTFYAVDSAGNAETPKSVTFKIDAIKPVTTATPKAVTGGEQITLSATDDFSGVASTVYSIDSAAAKTYTAPFTVTGTGKHAVTFHSTDKAGNAEASKTATFTNP